MSKNSVAKLMNPNGIAKDSAANLRTRSGAPNPLLPANKPAAAPLQSNTVSPTVKK
jgi:hypothetical protein